MPDGTTAKITANNQVSCSGRQPAPGNHGGGIIFHKDSGRGRNSPHYCGAGIVEMLAIQVRADINGDGVIETNPMVAGRDTGIERFNAGWLFETPLQIQGQVNVQGQIQTSFAGVNTDQAYGQLLPLRIDADADADADADGWPDVWDNAPGSPGYKDGVN